MHMIWGIVCIVFSLLAWVGQAFAALAPNAATRVGLSEPVADVDPTFYADVRGEAVWDTLTLWTLPVAGVLFILNNSLWPYFGLVGGGMYLYFAGRGIIVRLAMQRRGIRIGSQKTLTSIYFFLIIWGLIAVVTIIIAIKFLAVS